MTPTKVLQDIRVSFGHLKILVVKNGRRLNAGIKINPPTSPIQLSNCPDINPEQTN